MSKIKFFIAFVLLILVVPACNQLDKLTQFDISFSQTITMSAGVPVNTPFSIPTPPVENNTTTTFSSHNTTRDLVQEISLSQLKLTVESPSGEDFSILKSIEVYIQADGLDDAKIAWLDAVPAGESTITLDVSNADIKDYLFKDQFKLVVKTVTDEIYTQDYSVRIDSKFHVNAKILGI